MRKWSILDLIEWYCMQTSPSKFLTPFQFVSLLTIGALSWGILYINFDPEVIRTDAGLFRQSAPELPTTALLNRSFESIAKSESESRTTMLLFISYLNAGHRQLQTKHGYQTVFVKQERMEGVLKDPEVIEMNLQHAPFKVHMDWQTENRIDKLVFEEGLNDNKMVVYLSGILGRIKKQVLIDPFSEKALERSRHPITEVGLLSLCQRLISDREKDLMNRTPFECRLIETLTFDNRPCYCFVLTYPDPSAHEKYRKSVTYIDQEYLLPVLIQNFSWPEQQTEVLEEKLDEATLVERYSYSQIQFPSQVANASATSEGNTAKQ